MEGKESTLEEVRELLQGVLLIMMCTNLLLKGTMIPLSIGARFLADSLKQLEKWSSKANLYYLLTIERSNIFNKIVSTHNSSKNPIKTMDFH